MRRLALATFLVGVMGHIAAAQVLPRPGGGRGLQPVQRDTTRDSLAIKWPTPDSVAQSLLNKPGYSKTRYQADTAFFDAQRNVLDLLATPKRRAAVDRDSQVVVSDSGIYYSQGSRKVVTGGRYVLSNPSSGQADVVGHGFVTYDLTERSASLSNARLPVNNGDMWYMQAQLAKIVIDTTVAKESTAYAKGGSATSCDDSIPDFRFEFREAKRAGNNTLVARPAIMYIKDIPVMWFPFIFSDTRSGRHSGILAPQFGIGDIVRNSPNYRRNVEHVGYYWALSDYMDFGTWLDWRSSAGSRDNDPGWVRYNGDFQYKWIDRFLTGRVGVGYTTQADGQTNFALTWGHQQEFSHDSRFSMSANYVTSTALQRQNTFNPYSALATISSQASYQTKFGPASVSLGATRRQYPGRTQVDQTFPTLSLSTTSISVGKWLTWTPSLSFNRSDVLEMDQPGPGAWTYIVNPSTGLRDSVATKGRSSAQSSISFDTPFQIFGKEFKNSFRVSQQRNNFPSANAIYDVTTGLVNEYRMYAATYKTEVDWTPDFSLPPIGRNKFNLTPSIALSNVDPGPFWVATERTNGKYVHQSKRLTYGLSASPTLFGRFPGFGPFSAIRHSITPSIGYNFAPESEVSDEYLLAIGRTRHGYLGNLKQNALTFGLTQNVEAKVRPRGDTTGTASGETLRLLSLTVTPLSYDFERAKQGGSAIKGLTTETFGYSLNSDMLPGFEFSSSYSLFEGSTLSDSAIFKPYLTSIAASLRIGRDQNPFAVFTRLFGAAVPEPKKSPNPPAQLRPRPDDAQAAAIAAQPVAGDIRGGNRFIIPPSNGWQMQLSLARSSPRPPNGVNVIYYDPRARCEIVSQGDPFLLDVCLQKQLAQPTIDTPVSRTTIGGPLYNIPATMSLNSNLSFNLTPMWAASWQTTFDFERNEFAQHIVTLQRELHDWRANFGFTQSPNGNFAFNFMISLKAEPDIKFDYNKATTRAGVTSF